MKGGNFTLLSGVNGTPMEGRYIVVHPSTAHEKTLADFETMRTYLAQLPSGVQTGLPCADTELC